MCDIQKLRSAIKTPLRKLWVCHLKTILYNQEIQQQQYHEKLYFIMWLTSVLNFRTMTIMVQGLKETHKLILSLQSHLSVNEEPKHHHGK